MRLIVPIPRPLRLSSLVVVGFAIGLGLWLALSPGGSNRAHAVFDLTRLAGPLLVLTLALRSLPAGWRTQRAALRAPFWLTLGILANTSGQAVPIWYQLAHHYTAPFPWWADLPGLLVYPCLLLGIHALVASRIRAPEGERGIFDGAIVMVAAGVASWYFIIGPTVLRSDLGHLGTTIGIAYAIGDLLLVGGLLALLAYAQDWRWWRARELLALALLVIVATDTALAVRTAQGGYPDGPLDLGWMLGALLVALSVQALLLARTDRPLPVEVRATAPRRWRTVLPYATLPPMLALVIHSRFTAPVPGLLDRGLSAGTMLLLLLVLARQVVAILEHRRLQETATAPARLLEVANRDLSAANARLAVLATTDPVTGLANHRALMAALDQERERAWRYGKVFAVLFIDLDHFKAINDGYGHATGDAVLNEVGRVLRAGLREVDTVGRWGGEEFLAILPEVGSAGALAVAERVRHAVARHRFHAGGSLRLTCSIGVNAYGPECAEVDRVVTLADQALYTAKKLGRNQVRIAGDLAVAGLIDRAEDPRDALALAGTVEALAATVAARDPYRTSHIECLATVVPDLALACGLHPAEARLVSLVARVHDLGKVAIPDTILQKPGPLTAEEWAVVRTHPGVGADIVGRIPGLRAAAPLIRAHHEHWDGSGYPDGLAGEAIPLGARVLAVADAFAALTSDRPYRTAFTADEALAIVEQEGGSRFDPEIVACLRQVVPVAADVGVWTWSRRPIGLPTRTGPGRIAAKLDWDAYAASE